MLTQSEREWYLLRPQNGTAFCFHCQNWGGDCALKSSCPFNEDWKDAAEFEARVAARMATDENLGVDEDCPPDMPFGWGRLKRARLQVEEEMDEAD